jgi:hypothetical protein
MGNLQGSELIIVTVLCGVISTWVLNIIGSVKASKIGSSANTRLIFHIIGIFFYPIGAILGLIWLFKWRTSDPTNIQQSSYPPPQPSRASIS